MAKSPAPSRTLREFLASQEWVVYKVDGPGRRFFGDTAFGPMWKLIPDEVEVPDGIILDGPRVVFAYEQGQED